MQKQARIEAERIEAELKASEVFSIDVDNDASIAAPEADNPKESGQ